MAARRIRERFPATAVIVLSQYLEARYALRLLADQPSGLGYLLKERVSDIAILVDAMRRVIEGECVIDPTIVYRLMSRRRPDSPLSHSPTRARDSRPHGRGRSNAGIAGELVVSERTVETVSSQVFRSSVSSHHRTSTVAFWRYSPCSATEPQIHSWRRRVFHGLAEMVSIAAAADHYDVSQQTVRRWIASGRITAHRVGPRLIRVDLDEIEAKIIHTVPTVDRQS